MIYNYRYNYRALYIDVSRETIKILLYKCIYRRVYIHTITYHLDNTYHIDMTYKAYQSYKAYQIDMKCLVPERYFFFLLYRRKLPIYR